MHDHAQCQDSLQLDLHVEGSGPITLLVRDESRSTKSYQPTESPGHVTPINVCGDTCCPQRNTTVKQVSWGSTSSLANNDLVSYFFSETNHKYSTFFRNTPEVFSYCLRILLGLVYIETETDKVNNK